MAHCQGELTSVYAATMDSVDVAGDQLKTCTIACGFGEATHVHSVGDGACWIEAQFEQQFGTQASFLVDFYHLCEYVDAAATSCATDDPKRWFGEQKRALKASDIDDVLAILAPHRGPASVDDDQAPVRKCYRYIDNREGQFRYREALDAGLPIGSGEIEGAHHHVIQNRLKISGAWWKSDYAQKMLALRTLRANNQWESYWAQSDRLAA